MTYEALYKSSVTPRLFSRNNGDKEFGISCKIYFYTITIENVKGIVSKKSAIIREKIRENSVDKNGPRSEVRQNSFLWESSKSF